MISLVVYVVLSNLSDFFVIRSMLLMLSNDNDMSMNDKFKNVTGI